MSWQGIEGHDEIVAKFRQALSRGRLASTFLFVGPPGIGKRKFALKLAQSLLCQINPVEALEPCGKCPSCVQVEAGTHPDLITIRKPEGKSAIPVALLIGDKDHRMHEGLCHSISLKPFMGGRKIAVIDDADDLNQEGANCLLKTLEEPPPQSLLILIGSSAEKQLPTIRSRAQVVRFRPLEESVLSNLLLRERVVEDPTAAQRLARYSQGSFERALELSDAELWSFRGDLLSRLGAKQFDSVRLAQDVVKFVDEAGKEASARRDRSRVVIGFAAELFRAILRGESGALVTDDPELEVAAKDALRHWPQGTEIATECLERTLEALSHIERNANQATLIEAWLDDLAAIRTTGQPLPA